MIDEPAPEETIKFKATEDVIPIEESAEEFIPEHEERRANAPEENTEENGVEEYVGVQVLSVTKHKTFMCFWCKFRIVMRISNPTLAPKTLN